MRRGPGVGGGGSDASTTSTSISMAPPGAAPPAGSDGAAPAAVSRGPLSISIETGSAGSGSAGRPVEAPPAIRRLRARSRWISPRSATQLAAILGVASPASSASGGG